jgi:hypothetical protein
MQIINIERVNNNHELVDYLITLNDDRKIKVETLVDDGKLWLHSEDFYDFDAFNSFIRDHLIKSNHFYERLRLILFPRDRIFISCNEESLYMKYGVMVW